MAEIYWVARDLNGVPLGNHQFILIFLENAESMNKIATQQESGKKFVTLGGHNVAGNLVYVPNQSSDVTSVKESINPSLRGSFSDFDLEKHQITPPTGGGWSFATSIELLADKYTTNTRTSPVDYDLWNRNCSTWVNTLLKVAGLSESKRRKLGEFGGFDWGEEDLLDENLFR